METNANLGMISRFAQTTPEVKDMMTPVVEPAKADSVAGKVFIEGIRVGLVDSVEGRFMVYRMLMSYWPTN